MLLQKMARAMVAPEGSTCVILYTDHGSPVLVDPFFGEMLDGDNVVPVKIMSPGLDPVNYTRPGFHMRGFQDNDFFLYLDKN